MKGKMQGVSQAKCCRCDARIVGVQGHSEHGTFPRVIDCLADGMDMTKMIAKKISLAEVPENIIELQTNREECKVTCLVQLDTEYL